MAEVENEKPIVWVANRAGHDYGAALKYGREIKPLTLDDVNPFQLDRLADHLARGIGRFVESEEDFLLISGTPVVNALAMTLWLRRFDQCRLLQWHAKEREYILRTISSEQMSKLLDKHLFR